MKKPFHYALSTSWNYRDHPDAAGMAREIKDLGFDSVELNFALTQPQVLDFIRLKERGELKITSTHNFCPLPDGVDPKRASPEYYALSSPSRKERALALEFTKKSMDYAKKARARALVLHLGRVETGDATRRLFTLYGKPEFAALRKESLEEREKVAGPFFNNSIESLKILLDYAERINLHIGLENRFYINEIPDLEEFKMIFGSIRHEHLFYWHDTGHAQVYENLGILRHEDYLEALSGRLLGVHLHDIMLFDDHRSPGCGEFDFTRLRPFIKKDTIRVIEAHRPASAKEVRKSVGFLREKLGDGS